jgi:hypothetical protein
LRQEGDPDFTLGPSTIQTSSDAILNHRPLELGQGTHHVEEEPASGTGGINLLLKLCTM